MQIYRHQCRTCLAVTTRPALCAPCHARAERAAWWGTAIDTACVFAVLGLLGLALTVLA